MTNTPVSTEVMRQVADNLPELGKNGVGQRRLIQAAANELDEAREEIEIWKSVFPDIAPERVMPDRAKLEDEIKALRADNTTLRKISNDEASQGIPIGNFSTTMPQAALTDEAVRAEMDDWQKKHNDSLAGESAPYVRAAYEKLKDKDDD